MKPEIIEGYLAGELAPEETSEVESWLREDPEGLRVVAGHLATDQMLRILLGLDSKDQQIKNSVMAVIMGGSTSQFKDKLHKEIFALGSSDLDGGDSAGDQPETESPVIPIEECSAKRRRLRGRRASARKSRTRRKGARRIKPTSTAWGTWAAIAACLAVVVGTFFINQRQARKTPALIIASLIETSPNLIIIRDGKPIRVRQGMNIRSRDSIQVSVGGKAKVRYARDATAVTLLSGTKAEFWEQQGAKRIRLESGTLDCRVAKQAKDKRMVLVTPHAEVEVVGTQFTLQAKVATTRLDVTEGRTLMADRLAGGKAKIVSAGHYAIVASKQTILVMALSTTKQFQENFDRLPLNQSPPGWGNEEFDWGKDGKSNWVVVPRDAKTPLVGNCLGLSPGAARIEILTYEAPKWENYELVCDMSTGIGGTLVLNHHSWREGYRILWQGKKGHFLLEKRTRKISGEFNLLRLSDGEYIYGKGKPLALGTTKKLLPPLSRKLGKDDWVRVKVQVTDESRGVHLRAKLWIVGENEPQAWYFDFLDDGTKLPGSPIRRGKSGVVSWRPDENTEAIQRYDNFFIKEMKP